MTARSKSPARSGKICDTWRSVLAQHGNASNRISAGTLASSSRFSEARGVFNASRKRRSWRRLVSSASRSARSLSALHGQNGRAHVQEVGPQLRERLPARDEVGPVDEAAGESLDLTFVRVEVDRVTDVGRVCFGRAA